MEFIPTFGLIIWRS